MSCADAVDVEKAVVGCGATGRNMPGQGMPEPVDSVADAALASRVPYDVAHTAALSQCAR